MIELWRRFWYEPIDPAPLALFRQAFAWSLLIYAVAWSREAGEWLTAAGYHPPLTLDPQNGPQLPLLPGAALPFVGVVFYASLLAYIFGYARKWVVWVLVAAARTAPGQRRAGQGKRPTHRRWCRGAPAEPPTAAPRPPTRRR